MSGNQNRNYHKRKILIIYASIGVLFGACFPIGAIITEAIIKNTSLSIEAIGLLHRNNPLLYMIDTAPLFLGIFAFAGGMSRAKAEQANIEMTVLLDEVHETNAKNEALLVKIKQELKRNEVMRLDIEDSSSNLVLASNNLSSNMTKINELDMSVDEEVININAHVEEINAISEDLIQRFGLFNDSAIQMHKDMTESKETMISHVAISEQIVEEISTLNQKLNTLAGVAKEVESVIRIVHRISKDIKLLALNAAIEASRAGDAGKGFAVVASEIQKLSGQTDVAVKRISKQINVVTDGVYETTDSMMKVSQNSEHLRDTSNKSAMGYVGLDEKVVAIKNASGDITTQIEQQGMAIVYIRKMAENLANHSHDLREYLEESEKVITRTEGHIMTLKQHLTQDEVSDY